MTIRLMRRGNYGEDYGQGVPQVVATTKQPVVFDSRKRLLVIPFNAVASLGSGNTDVQTHTLPTSYAFIWTATTHNSSMGDYTVQVRDTFRTEDLFVNPVLAKTIAGTGENPFMLYWAAGYGHKFEPGTVIQVTFVNVSGGSIAQIRFNMIGFKDEAARPPEIPLEGHR